MGFNKAQKKAFLAGIRARNLKNNRPKAIGSGDYEMSNNTLIEPESIDHPKIGSVGESGVRIRHREYLQNIVSGLAGSFTLQSFPLNPGLQQVFPWLSQIAAGFEQYRINGMVWQFKSTCNDALSSANTAIGSIIMATEYDSSRPVFANQQQMANHEFATTGRQSQNITHAIECKKSVSPVNELWVRTGSIPKNDDERLYDFGLFQIATVGQQAGGVTIGELWVYYDITFYKPQLISGVGLELLSDHFSNATGVSLNNYFGTGAGLTAKSGSNLGCTLGPSSITFPTWITEGTYLVIYEVFGTSAAAVVAPTFSITNMQLVYIWNQDSVYYFTNSTATATYLIWGAFYQVTSSGAKINLIGGTLPGGSPITVDLMITQINGGITI